MSVLTKVFVVLVTVLSVALMGVVLANVASQENYKQTNDGLAASNKIQEERLKVANAALLSQSAMFTDQLKGEADARKTVEDAYRLSQNSLAAAQSKAQIAESDRAVQAALVIVANGIVTQTTKQLESTQKELDAARTENLQSKTKLIEVANTNTGLNGQIDGLGKEVRILQEANSKLKDENSGLRVKLAGAGGGTSGTEATASPLAPIGLRGAVTAVDSSSGTAFVQINIGTSDGVQSGMKFYVYNTSANKPFLGQLVVQKVDDRVSSGFIQRQTGTIGVGDSVLAGG